MCVCEHIKDVCVLVSLCRYPVTRPQNSINTMPSSYVTPVLVDCIKFNYCYRLPGVLSAKEFSLNAKSYLKCQSYIHNKLTSATSSLVSCAAALQYNKCKVKLLIIPK